jgi:hypothetical protein
MILACQRLGLDPNYARGFDNLPIEVQDHYRGALIGTLTEDALRHALAVATAGLLNEGESVPAGSKVRPMLQQFCAVPQ